MIINLRPIHSIGEFYKDLGPEGQKQARALAGKAHAMPKIKIEQEVIRLRKMTDEKNFKVLG